MNTWDFIPEFIKYLETDFKNKLMKDALVWGDTWLNRSRENQENRLCTSLLDRIDKFVYGNQPLDEESILGDLFINWIRRNHPEIWKK